MAPPIPAAAPTGLPYPTSAVPPVLPPGLTQFFLLPTLGAEADGGSAGGTLVFEPRVLGFADVAFIDRKHKLEYRHAYRLLAEPPDPVRPEPWREAEEIPEAISSSSTHAAALWAVVPESVNAPRKVKGLEKGFVDFLMKHAMQTVLHNRHLGLLSKPNEDRDAFEARCREAAVKAADEELAAPPARRKAAGDGAEAAPPEPAPAAADAAPAKRSPKDEERVRKRWEQKAADLKEVRLKTRKADIQVTHFALAWAPVVWAEGQSGPTRRSAYDGHEVPADSWRAAGFAAEEVEVG